MPTVAGLAANLAQPQKPRNAPVSAFDQPYSTSHLADLFRAKMHNPMAHRQISAKIANSQQYRENPHFQRPNKTRAHSQHAPIVQTTTTPSVNNA